MTDDILSSVWEAGDWRYKGGQRNINGGKFLAIKVRLQGQHEVPSSCIGGLWKRSLELLATEALPAVLEYLVRFGFEISFLARVL